MLVLWYCSSSFFFFMASCSCCLMICMCVSRSVSSCTMGLCARPSRSVFPFDCRGNCLLSWDGEGEGGGGGGSSLHCKHSRLFCCSSWLERWWLGQTEFSQMFHRFCWLLPMLHLYVEQKRKNKTKQNLALTCNLYFCFIQSYLWLVSCLTTYQMRSQSVPFHIQGPSE